jgi:hypothetical protein
MEKSFKICSTCKIEKSISEFCKNKSLKDFPQFKEKKLFMKSKIIG